MKFVLDASVAVKWFAPEKEAPIALGLLGTGAAFVAPDVLRLEVASALLKKERRREAQAGTAATALIELDRIGCDWVAQGDILPRATALASTWRHGVFSCLYLVIAQERGLPLATFDGAMAALATRLAIPLWAVEDGA